MKQEAGVGQDVTVLLVGGDIDEGAGAEDEDFETE